MARKGCCMFFLHSLDSPGTQQDRLGPLGGAVNSPQVAREALVSNTPSPGSRSTMGPASQGSLPLTGWRSDMAPQIRHPAALGLAPSQYLSQGLDEAVLRTVDNARAPSARANYGQKWRVFSTWCHNRQENPANCPIEMILRFLQSILDSNRAPSTIKVYTAAISFFHETVGHVTVGRHPLVSQLIKGEYHLSLMLPQNRFFFYTFNQTAYCLFYLTVESWIWPGPPWYVHLRLLKHMKVRNYQTSYCRSRGNNLVRRSSRFVRLSACVYFDKQITQENFTVPPKHPPLTTPSALVTMVTPQLLTVVP